MYTKIFWKLLEYREWVSILLAFPGSILVVVRAISHTIDQPTASRSADAQVAGAVFLPTYIISVIAIRVWIEETNGYFTGKGTELRRQLKSDLTNFVLNVSLFLSTFLVANLITRVPGGAEVFVEALSDAILCWLLLNSLASILLSFNFLYRAINQDNPGIRTLRIGIFVLMSLVYSYFVYFCVVRLIPDTRWFG
jgi:hypothetical protein